MVRALSLVFLATGCATPGAPPPEAPASRAEAEAFCQRLARLSYDCPEEFVDARLAIEAPPGDRADVRTDWLRVLRAQRTEPEGALAARCADDRRPVRRSDLARLDGCELKAACTLKLSCLRPLLEARAAGR